MIISVKKAKAFVTVSLFLSACYEKGRVLVCYLRQEEQYLQFYSNLY
jgi:hypothetical protein